MSTEAKLRELLEQHVEVQGLEVPLELSSLELVMVVEAIEDAFGLRVRAADVTPENFGTLGKMVKFVESTPSPLAGRGPG